MLTFLKAFHKMSRTPKPRNILSLTTEEKRQFLNSFDHVFSDIDGVVWNIDAVIEGSGNGYKALREAGKHLTFITNNSVRAEEQCLQKLQKNGIEIEAENLMHPAKSIAEYLKSINFEGLIYILASESFKNVLRKEGFQLLDGPNEVATESFVDLMRHVADRQPVKAVIIDFDFNLTLTKMMKAHFYLHQPDCLLIGGATDKILAVTKDLFVLGPGGFLNVLEDVSPREMLHFGKPGKQLAEVLMKRYGLKDPQRILMIGDMLEQDIRFGKSCGFQTLLVLSGGCTLEQMLKQTDDNVIPNYYADGMVDFVEFMKDVNKSHG